MRLHRITIRNFRNFKALDVELGEQVVIVGENKIGKTNLLHALRLVLDPSLPDAARQLQMADFWDGLGLTRSKDDIIEVSVELTDFDNDENILAVLAEHIVECNPVVARLTYVFRPFPTLQRAPKGDEDYEFLTYGGGRQENRFGYEVRRRIPLDILNALRDAERDLSHWTRSPLRPLLDRVAKRISQEDIRGIAERVRLTTEAVLDVTARASPVTDNNGDSDDIAVGDGSVVGQTAPSAGKPLRELDEDISRRLDRLVGSNQALQTSLGFSPTDPDHLLRSIRLLIDGGRREVSDASLGSANLLYFAMKSLELDQLAEAGERDHTFLAIEEPEAHLHPHLQRAVFRDFLSPRAHQQPQNQGAPQHRRQTTILTTHSPNIVSVAPLDSIVLLRRSDDGTSAVGFSAARISLSEADRCDVERYLDVTRAQVLFGRAAILVEGSAEEYLVPVFAKLLGYDLDQLGIAVCAVSGTNFVPYVRLLGDRGFRIPFAILTDRDPRSGASDLGSQRAVKLVREIVAPADLPWLSSDEACLKRAAYYGVFVNNRTLEVDLFDGGAHEPICRVLSELCSSGTAKERAEHWLSSHGAASRDQLMADIEAIGKGRFAQRLASYVNANHCPLYIKEAIAYVSIRCQ